MQEEITVNINIVKGPTFEIKILPTATVSQLKEKIAQENKCETKDIKLIYKGNQLKDDEETLEHIKIIENNNIFVLISKKKEVDDSTNQPISNAGANIPSQVPPSFNSGQINNNFAPAGLPNSGQIDIVNLFTQLQKIPMVQEAEKEIDQAVQQMMSNPQALKEMLQQNPIYKQILEDEPESFQKLLSNPNELKLVVSSHISQQKMQQALSGLQGGSGANPEAQQTGQQQQYPSQQLPFFGQASQQPFDLFGQFGDIGLENLLGQLQNINQQYNPQQPSQENIKQTCEYMQSNPEALKQLLQQNSLYNQILEEDPGAIQHLLSHPDELEMVVTTQMNLNATMKQFQNVQSGGQGGNLGIGGQGGLNQQQQQQQPGVWQTGQQFQHPDLQLPPFDMEQLIKNFQQMFSGFEPGNPPAQ
ncbi:hypothetical protein ABPG74_011395 [Tetrahymena malaccensis]